MGRKPSRNLNLPAGMRARHRGKVTYYFLDSGKRPRTETPLGKDYVLAVQKWAELTASSKPVGSLVTFRFAAEGYMRDVVPTKGYATQKDNHREIKQLYRFFDDPPASLEGIDPVHVRQYLDSRKSAPIRANREKALFSSIWNYARERGLTAKENPCRGVKGFKEVGRQVYIADEVYMAVWSCAEAPIRDALDLAYLTGQRPADVLSFTRADIRDGELWVEQIKTGAKLRIAMQGEFEAVIKRLSARKVMGLRLINDEKGQPLSPSMLRGGFDRARAKAAAEYPDLAAQIKAFQFRDLRAKAGTDKDGAEGMGAAREQLGHTSEQMTRHYVRHRKGKLVTPTK